MLDITRQDEKFMGGPIIAPQERMHITLNRKGMLFLNANAHRMIGKPFAVYLYYNRQLDRIVVESASQNFPETFPVKQFSNGWKIHASPFCRHFGIKLDTTERFVHPDIDASGRLYLTLSNTVMVSLRTPRKKKG
jgi:hypothetical protein